VPFPPLQPSLCHGHVLSSHSLPRTFQVSKFLRLDALSAPDVLEQTIALSQAVQGVVALAHRADEAAEGVDMVLAGDGAAVLVNLGDRNLDGTVVLGLDDAVGGAALARDVAAREECEVSALLGQDPVNGRGFAHTGRRSRHGRSPFCRCLGGCDVGEGR
jgi:hypothetical protein